MSGASPQTSGSGGREAVRTAVVLGASSGIGLGCARSLAAAGHRVVLFARDPGRLEAARQTLVGEHLSGEIHAIAGDLRAPADLERLFAETEERWGSCEILVNNSGGPPFGDLLSLSDSDWEESLRAQALPVFRAIRLTLPSMMRRGWGRIITIGSVSAKQPIDGLDLSNFTRAGLAAVLKSLSRKTAAAGVTVHLICPGSILTERSRSHIEARAAQKGASFEDTLKLSESAIPAGRLGTADEVGDLVAFLVSERAAYMTGNIIQIDGGLTMGIP